MPLAAQTPGSALPAIWGGVYTEQQAARGKETSGNSCVGCHNRDLTGSRTGPPLTGAAFMTKWESQPLQRVYRIIRETMPRNNPGTLTDQTAIDLLALILQTNGLPAGAAELRASPETLEALTIVPKGGPTRKEVPNFTLVQTIGCLTESPARVWALTNASDVVATKDVPAAATELKDAAVVPPGSLTLRLVSVLPFKPDAHRDQRVLLKGIINRYPGEVLLNVTGLQATGANCR